MILKTGLRKGTRISHSRIATGSYNFVQKLQK